MVSAAPTNEKQTVLVSRRVTSHNASSTSTPNSTSASCGETSRMASGRPRVRFTCGSMLRSAKSLITQPAERITMVPAMNTNSSFDEGMRCAPGSARAAIHSAHSVGHSSSRMPTGRSSRISCAWCHARRANGAPGNPYRSSLTDAAIFLCSADPSLAQWRDNTIIVAQQMLGNLTYPGQHVRIADQVGHAQLAWAAQLQVLARDLEAIVAVAQGCKPLACQLR